MDAYEYGELLKVLTSKIENIKNIVKPDEITARLTEISDLQQEPSFWDDSKNASKVSQEKTKKERVLARYEKAYASVYDAVEFF